MRVALCLSGQARGVDKTWDGFLKYIINPTNCDIFISFANDTSLTNFGNVEEWTFTELEFIKDPSLEYLYSIARGKTEYIRHLGQMGQECSNLAVLRQFYYINRANNMKIEYEKKNEFVYDWVIRSRADIIINSGIGDLSKLDNNYVYSPDTNTHDGLNDMFAFGSSKNMDIYSDRVGEIKKIESPPFPFYNPHVELKYILDKNNIPLRFISLDVEKELSWRGEKSINVFKYYGEHGEHIIRERLNE